MATRNLNVLGQMKNSILQTLLSDIDVVKIIKNTKDDITLPALDLRYKTVVPWKKTVGVTTEAQTFVTFEIGLGAAQNCAVRPYEVIFYIMTHESLMKFDTKTGESLDLPDRGTRIDVLADKIDYLINGTSELGFGKTEFLESRTFEPVDGYHGRTLRYLVQGWNRSGDRL